MPGYAITDDTFAGLPLLICDMDPGLYHIDVKTPMLVIRDDVGSEVEVMNPSDRQVRFRQAPLRFDLFTDGLYMHATSTRKATKSLVVALPPQWLPTPEGPEDDGFEWRPRFQFTDPALRRLVWRLSTHHGRGEPLGADYNRAVSHSIVSRLFGLQYAADALHPDSVGLHPEAQRLVQALIDESLQDPPSVPELAARVGMGQVRFVRMFKLSFAATPHQYIVRRRLARASEMLRDTDASVATIAMETGFASHAHFSTVFRASTGVAPRAFRRRPDATP